jgi:hypothetical protein
MWTDLNKHPLIMLYRKSWDFLRVFVICEGLGEIIRLLTDTNLYMRGQAAEIFLSAVDCDMFDWFDTNSSGIVTNALHCQLLSLKDSKHFFDAIFSNRDDSYPGGSLHCLQILAFWLSWVRARFVPEHKLRLHPHIVSELRKWALKDESAGISPELLEAEKKLVSTLLEDFLREPLLDISPHDQNLYYFGGIKVPVELNSADLSNQALEALSVHVRPKDYSLIDNRTSSELKDEGNKYYKNEDYAKALELYLLAKERILEDSDIELRINIVFNLSSVHWKFAQICEDQTTKEIINNDICSCGHEEYHIAQEVTPIVAWENRRISHITLSELHAREVLNLSRGAHVKATYRLGSCLLSRELAVEAFELLDKFSSFQSAPKDEVEMLKGLRRRSLAAIMASKPRNSDSLPSKRNQYDIHDTAETILSEFSTIPSSQGNAAMSKSTAHILSKLRLREKIERDGYSTVFETIDEGYQADVVESKTSFSDVSSEQAIMQPKAEIDVPKFEKQKKLKKTSALDEEKKSKNKVCMKAQKDLKAALHASEFNMLQQVNYLTCSCIVSVNSIL